MAQLVLVWLGSEDKHTPLAYAGFSRISSLVSGESSEMLPKVKAGDEIYVDLFYREYLLEGTERTVKLKGELSLQETEAMGQLMEKSYWYRAWIVQEFCLASTAAFHCGEFCISSEVMVRTCKVLADSTIGDHERQGSEVIRNFTQKQGVEVLYLITLRSYAFYPSNLLLYLNICNMSLCTEPRDYMYAFVGLDPTCGIAINYDISLENLLDEVRKMEIREQESLLRRRHLGYDSRDLRRNMLGEQKPVEEALRSLRMRLDYHIDKSVRGFRNWITSRKVIRKIEKTTTTS
ncbi:hypothetical protein GLAREA_09868 [Glarea lozoyensis ATCC 20868]|uniref:Uncharacterized protein n=1 Tax=Glarea lozoyensis (strain ATCC 20868 / MF5171) TaxID=1116229 RepID=S3CQM2_GLAL2|nr:uncharacterized protein GLAREA_09868 [Glarea lozoyensis ATCC 20868]EPE28747.1 hypothetical protein GLAREA_09868 [Glarea lozoyensis ATCC 20868]